MYREYFGFEQKPFELVPNPRFLYRSQAHQKAINYLQYGIKEGAGFILFTGEIGSGKTTILRDLIHNVDPQTVVSMVFNTRVDADQLVAMINEDFGLEVEGKDKRALLRDLNDFLIDQNGRGHQPIIIIDEAQNLCAEALEEIRLLSNLETDSFKLVQIVLVGQPELKDLIANPSLRQLRQRIGVNCHLEPLSREETEDYVYHRLNVAGNRSAVTFQDGTFDVIFKYSHGIPRLINVFCDFLLLAAFAEETRDLSREMVEEVIGDVAWKEGVAQRQETPQAVPSGSSVLANELFRRLAFIENGILKINTVMEDLNAVKQKIKNFESLMSITEEQQARLRRIEETLQRMDRLLNSAASEEHEPGQVVDINQAKKKKDGLLARLFG